MKININSEKYIRLNFDEKHTLSGTGIDYQILKFKNKLLFTTCWESLEMLSKYYNISEDNPEMQEKYYSILSERNLKLASDSPIFLEYEYLGEITNEESNLNWKIANIEVFFNNRMFIMNPNVKKEFVDAELTGLRYFPCWKKSYRPNEKPDYWLGMCTNQFPAETSIEFHREILMESSLKSNIAQVLSDDFSKYALDFNHSPTPNGSTTLPYLYSYPNIISQKAYQILKNFDGINFYPINTVSRRLDLEDNIEIIK